VVKKGKDVIVGDSSIMDKSLKYENQSIRSQLTQEKNMNNNKNYNYSDNSNLGINTDKSSSSVSTKEELTAATTPTLKQEGETKITLDKKEKEQHKDQVSSITTNTVPLEEVKEKTNKFLDNQTQQIKNKTSTISETTNKINDNINQNQDTHKIYLEKNINTAANIFQQETTNKSQSIFNNYIELQNNVANTFQSTFSRLLDNTSHSYWNYFQYPKRYQYI